MIPPEHVIADARLFVDALSCRLQATEASMAPSNETGNGWLGITELAANLREMQCYVDAFKYTADASVTGSDRKRCLLT